MYIYEYVSYYSMPNTLPFQKRPKTTSRSYSKTAKKRPNPTLESIEMVEETLSGMNIYPTKNKLWRKLPRQIQYQTFSVILDYLEKSNKMLYDDDGTIVWTFSNAPEHELLRKSLD